MAALRTSAVLIHRHGGPEVLDYGEIEVPDPGPGEVRIVQQAIGLNFADVYQRRGSHGPHAAQPFPIILGSQGAGVVESLGPQVQGFSVGQPVAYVHPGAYAQARLVPAARLVPLPEGLTLETAAATLLRGMTAEYLLHRLFAVQRGHRVLVHAAAGGMGQILSAWARALGAEVIGTVGSEAKRAAALSHGCHHVIDYRQDDFAQQVLDITGAAGVHVAYDAVGRDVFFPTLDCMATRGVVISYGTASGDVEGVDLQRLHAKSLSVCRPTLKSFIASTDELHGSVATFAAAVRSGAITPEVSQRFALAETRAAHEALEGRRTTGACILVP
ncbi:quinone oxidoreductase family protein [Bordetella tumulicola]|uniref:quinone oxidoreductase family protein n=1 Tax=Bordetella tumulicola TaxID=1649133 RepID=UPI0039F0FA80